MTHEIFDAAVVGLGAMGCAACLALARRGRSVLGIEQYSIAHNLGSSHGRSRVIRKAYFEDSRYVPLAEEAFLRWRGIAAETGDDLLTRTGCLNMGPANHPAVQGVLQSVALHQLPHERLSGTEIRIRWPAFSCEDNLMGVYEEDAGFLAPEKCLGAMLRLATTDGAVIVEQQTVQSWNARNGLIEIITNRSHYRAHMLVLSVGPWLPAVCADLGLPLRVERQFQLWFKPNRPELFNVGQMPVFIQFMSDAAYYGIPQHDRDGVKIARHHGGETTTAETVNRRLMPTDESDVRAYLRHAMPLADGPLLDARVCLYTNTPDEHFIVDHHPACANVILCGGFSGHGFKFAPVIGEIVADLLLDGRSHRDIAMFRLNRFAS